jgi:hypothetical protein
MYADLDVEALKPMDELLQGGRPVLAFLSQTWWLRHNIPNAWMASPPGHEFWRVSPPCHSALHHSSRRRLSSYTHFIYSTLMCSCSAFSSIREQVPRPSDIRQTHIDNQACCCAQFCWAHTMLEFRPDITEGDYFNEGIERVTGDHHLYKSMASQCCSQQLEASCEPRCALMPLLRAYRQTGFKPP